MTRRLATIVSILLAWALVLPACGSSSDGDASVVTTSPAPTSSAPPPATTSVPTTTTVAPTTVLPDPVDDVESEPLTVAAFRNDVLGWMDGDGTFDTEVYERTFSPEFRAIASFDDVGVVVDAITEGSLTWDDPVEIRDELDSYPSGTTQDVPAGTEMTVRELAELMISISDNTATDHLIDLVSRTRIEAAQSAYGLAQPERNQPFLTTRELFQIKLTPDIRDRYLAADEPGRRAILDEVADLPLRPVAEAVGGWLGPIEVDTVEWFATPAEICSVLVALNADPDASAILQINPGIADDTGRWSSIGFKGGSEPGVLATAWIVTDADGRTFTLTGATVSEGLVDELPAAVAYAGLRDQFEAP